MAVSTSKEQFDNPDGENRRLLMVRIGGAVTSMPHESPNKEREAERCAVLDGTKGEARNKRLDTRDVAANGGKRKRFFHTHTHIHAYTG